MEDLHGMVEVLVCLGGHPYKEAVEEVVLNVQLRPFFLPD